MKELYIKKCEKCGATVQILDDCNCENCGIKCCGEEMKKLNSNANNILSYVRGGDTIVVKADHKMDKEHYIEWIAMSSDKVVGKKFLEAGEEPAVAFPYIKGSKIYAYCNKEGLFSKEVE